MAVKSWLRSCSKLKGIGEEALAVTGLRVFRWVLELDDIFSAVLDGMVDLLGVCWLVCVEKMIL